LIGSCGESIEKFLLRFNAQGISRFYVTKYEKRKVLKSSKAINRVSIWLETNVSGNFIIRCDECCIYSLLN
jgi:hypothetical protein